MTPPPTRLYDLARLYLDGERLAVRDFINGLPPDRLIALYEALRKPVEDELYRHVGGLDTYWVALASIHDYVERKVRHHRGHRHFETTFMDTVI